MTDQPSDVRRRLRFLKPSVLTLIVLIEVYTLSQAPLVSDSAKERGTRGEITYVIGSEPVYAPLDWLIMNTPLRYPLLAWASYWDVSYVEPVIEIESSPDGFRVRSTKRRLK